MTITTRFNPGDRVQIKDIQQPATVNSIKIIGDFGRFSLVYSVMYWCECKLVFAELWEHELESP